MQPVELSNKLVSKHSLACWTPRSCQRGSRTVTAWQHRTLCAEGRGVRGQGGKVAGLRGGGAAPQGRPRSHRSSPCTRGTGSYRASPGRVLPSACCGGSPRVGANHPEVYCTAGAGECTGAPTPSGAACRTFVSSNTSVCHALEFLFEPRASVGRENSGAWCLEYSLKWKTTTVANDTLEGFVVQADAKKKRAQLAAAQAETPQVAVEALQVEITSMRRRAADAERARCETEAISAEYTQQLEVLARQLEEARAMQRGAREAAERATLANPPSAPQPPDIAHDATCLSFPTTQTAPIHAAAGGASSMHLTQQQQTRDHSPQQDPVAGMISTPLVEPSGATRQVSASNSPPADPEEVLPTAALAGNDMQPIVIPPPPMHSVGPSAAAPAQHAPSTVLSPLTEGAHTSVNQSPLSSKQPPPVVIPPPQQHLGGQDRGSPGGPSISALHDASASGRCKTSTAGAQHLQQHVVPVQCANKKAVRTQSTTAGDTVLSPQHPHGAENQPVLSAVSEVTSSL